MPAGPGGGSPAWSQRSDGGTGSSERCAAPCSPPVWVERSQAPFAQLRPAPGCSSWRCARASLVTNSGMLQTRSAHFEGQRSLLEAGLGSPRRQGWLGTWGHQTHCHHVSVLVSSRDSSVLSGSLKRHFEPAGDPSSSAAAEPIAALGFVPSATVMPMVLSPAHIPVPGCPQRGVLSAGWESICSARYGRNGLSSAATCWLQLVSLCVWKLLSHSLNH